MCDNININPKLTIYRTVIHSCEVENKGNSNCPKKLENLSEIPQVSYYSINDNAVVVVYLLKE